LTACGCQGFRLLWGRFSPWGFSLALKPRQGHGASKSPVV